MKTLLWFRNDLRLNDNITLVSAIRESEAIVPLYVLDERLLQSDRWGFRRLGPYRLKFLLESLMDLAHHLEDKGSRLLFKIGKPEQLIPEIADAYDCGQVFASKEYAPEEIQTEQQIADKINLYLFHNTGLYHPEAVPFPIAKTPDVFTQFRKKVEKYAEVARPLETPEQINSPAESEYTPLPSLEEFGIPSLPIEERGVLDFKGGATAALERMDYYFWDKELLSIYKETRNGLVGGDYSSKFSCWLANGSISPRLIFHEVDVYEAEVEKNRSTYWLKFELLWREYFRFVTMRYGRKVFYPGGIQDKSVNWNDDDKKFRAWATGTTGDDFVDANMRELLFTGYMSNRGRQNVASYLVHRLREDWRKGAAWFESLLVDYDVYSNYGNWMYAAGVGNDPRDRVFNTRKQAKMYDTDGSYRRLWLEKGARDPEAFYDKILNYASQQTL